MNRAQLKNLAKSQIKGNVLMLALITVIGMGLGYLASMIPVLGLFVMPLMSLCIIYVYLKLANGVKPDISELFNHFDAIWPVFKLYVLTMVFTVLWTMLLVIPGIIKAYAYSQAYYVLAENPGIGAREALRRSEAMMKGHKMEMFMLNMSFMGWAILGTFTFGLLYIWLIPYMQATMTNFYNSIKPQVSYLSIGDEEYNSYDNSSYDNSSDFQF